MNGRNKKAFLVSSLWDISLNEKLPVQGRIWKYVNVAAYRIYKLDLFDIFLNLAEEYLYSYVKGKE